MLSVNDYIKSTEHPFGMLKGFEHASEKEAFMAWCLIQCIEAKDLNVDIKTPNNEDYMCENPIKLLLKTGKQTYRLAIKAKGLLYTYYGKQIGCAIPTEPQHGHEPKKECKDCVFYHKLVPGNCVSVSACKHQQRVLNKAKPLAQYLGEYINQELVEVGRNASGWWQELLEQALDAYESTENVVIKIEGV